MKPAEHARQHHAAEKNPQPQGDGVVCGTQIELTHTTDKDITRGQIENPRSTFTVDEEDPLQPASQKGFGRGTPSGR